LKGCFSYPKIKKPTGKAEKQRKQNMDENNEQLKTAVQILAQVADQALINGPQGRQRDQAVQILARHFGLAQEPANNPPIEMPKEEEKPESD
tara:strand:+ start:31 stop:306 length:276 start_codon:yes stop_codon:yes gene_type:complete